MNEFAIIATFTNPAEAQIAQARLEEDGVPAFLDNYETASALWTITSAIGGIRLRVPRELEAKARQILAQTPIAGNATDIHDDEEQPDDDEPYESLSSREETAERAFKSAILGLLFFPLLFYTCWLVIRVWQSDEPLRGGSRTRAWWAAGIAGCFLALIVLMFTQR
jgi:hypothetical protein